MADLDLNKDGMVEVGSIFVKVNFTQPDMISFSAEDSILVEIEKKMFSEETAVSVQPEQMLALMEDNRASF